MNPSTRDPDGRSTVLRALRYLADEVQFGRVLHGVCQQEPVAHKLVADALELAAAAGSSHAAAMRENLPTGVRCQEQTDLFAETGRIGLRRRARAVGAVDLTFIADGGWRLLVEIKIDAGFGERQRERYLGSRHPLLAIVRDPAATRTPALDPAHGHNWLGVVGWSQLADTLDALPVEPDDDRERWRELLAIMRADGDFLSRKPARHVDSRQERALVQAALPAAMSALRAALAREHGAAGRALADRVAEGKLRNGGGWAGCPLHFDDAAGEVFVLEVRNASSVAPIAGVRWYAPVGFRDRRLVADAQRRVQQRGFAARPHGEFLREEPLSSTLVREQGAEAMLAAFFAESLDAVVAAGGLRADL